MASFRYEPNMLISRPPIKAESQAEMIGHALGASRRDLLLLAAVAEIAQNPKVKPVDPITTRMTAGRNDPCPCGSGKKFKKCCRS